MKDGNPMHDNLPVTNLVTCARNGEKQAWDAVVERYAPLIWSICRRHGLGRADTEDVGQAVWLHLVGHLGSLREPAALPGWLATTAMRECLRVLRAARPLGAGQMLDAETLPDHQAEAVEQELLAAERQAALRAALLDLPPCGQRLIALLLEDPPVPYAEISARLGIPIGSIGPNRRRYLDKMRRHPAIAALIRAESDQTFSLPLTCRRPQRIRPTCWPWGGHPARFPRGQPGRAESEGRGSSAHRRRCRRELDPVVDQEGTAPGRGRTATAAQPTRAAYTSAPMSAPIGRERAPASLQAVIARTVSPGGAVVPRSGRGRPVAARITVKRYHALGMRRHAVYLCRGFVLRISVIHSRR
jgi:RNA polymerase sigma factor (sigma-70 family)